MLLLLLLLDSLGRIATSNTLAFQLMTCLCLNGQPRRSTLKSCTAGWV
jgi:hypothetical protein